MKRVFFYLMVVTSLAVVSQANATEGGYIGIQSGAAQAADADGASSTNTWTTEYDLGFTIGAVAGYDFGHLRFEGEFAYQKNGFDRSSSLGPGLPGGSYLGGDLKTLSGLANVIFEFENESSITPFIGAGIGIANLEVDNLRSPVFPGSTNADDTVFAYQFIAGISIAVSERIALDLSYRYLATEDPDLHIRSYEYASHNVLLGIRVYF